MELVCKPPRCPYVIEMLEWFETPTCFVLILERPDPCYELYRYARLHYNCCLPESQVKTIMAQVILATCHCYTRGVFHRDIKEENILLNPQTLEVKLIDFGCGALLKETYTIYAGNCTSEKSKSIEWSSVVDHFCYLTDHTLFLSFLQALKYSPHLK